MTGGRWRAFLRNTGLALLAILIAVYAAYGVKYRNPNWIFTPPNVLHSEGRTYKPSNLEPMDWPPPRGTRAYVEIATLNPFRQTILGVKDAPLQMNLYLEWHGKYRSYGILGGP